MVARDRRAAHGTARRRALATATQRLRVLLRLHRPNLDDAGRAVLMPARQTLRRLEEGLQAYRAIIEEVLCSYGRRGRCRRDGPTPAGTVVHGGVVPHLEAVSLECGAVARWRGIGRVRRGGPGWLAVWPRVVRGWSAGGSWMAVGGGGRWCSLLLGGGTTHQKAAEHSYHHPETACA